MITVSGLMLIIAATNKVMSEDMHARLQNIDPWYTLAIHVCTCVVGLKHSKVRADVPCSQQGTLQQSPSGVAH